MAAVICDGTGRDVAAQRPLREVLLEGSHRAAAKAPRSQPECHVSRPDPVLYEVLFLLFDYKCPKSVSAKLHSEICRFNNKLFWRLVEPPDL